MSKALGYSGMTAGACPHIEKIKMQGDCPLCTRLCTLWRSSQEFKDLQSDPATSMARGRPTGVSRNHLEGDCLLGGGMWPTAFGKVRSFVEGLATAAATKAINVANAEASRIKAAQRRDAEWRARPRRGEGPRRYRPSRERAQREAEDPVNNVSSPAPLTPDR